MDQDQTKCGYVAIIGAPNAGKSTLVNALVGSKVSIVSPKVQTTRHQVLGIVMKDHTQIILVDTPGIFRPKKRLERAMVQAAWEGSLDADVICLLVDVTKNWSSETMLIIEGLRQSNKEIWLILNKIDRIKKESLLVLAAQAAAMNLFKQVFMISAYKKSGLTYLLDHLQVQMPSGPYLFPEDQLSDLPTRLWAAEITREQIFLQLYQELPYGIMVETDSWVESDKGEVRVDQTIYVSRQPQKLIVIGEKGAQIKRLGEQARRELESLLGQRIHLFLNVKVKEDWSEKPGIYQNMGLNFDS